MYFSSIVQSLSGFIYATNPAAVRLLWDVAQIPDFRKILADTHIGLLSRIYLHLMGAQRRLPNDWVAAQIARIDRTDGNIEDLTARISHVPASRCCAGS